MLKKIDAVKIVLSCFLFWILLTICSKTVLVENRWSYVPIVFGIYVCILLFLIYKKNTVFAIQWLLYGAFLIRCLYIIVTPYNVSLHDLGFFSNGTEMGYGHLGYIDYIYQNWKNTDFDPRTVISFYNPPLYYWIAAIWLKINRVIGIQYYVAIENLRILPLFYVSMSVFVVSKILDMLEMKEQMKTYCLVFYAFFPTLTLFSGSLATDSLVLLFCLLIILFAMRWYRDVSIINIVMLALSIGCGMLTKANAGLLAVGVAVIFLLKLYAWVKEKKDLKKLLIQFLVFGLICIPLGLFWMIREYILFGMPFTYVPKLGVESSQYIGNCTIWDRVGIPSLKQCLYAKNKFDANLDYNILLNLFRSALFDEMDQVIFYGKIGEITGVILLYLNMVFAFLCHLCSILYIKKKWKFAKENMKVFVLFFSIVYLILM